MHRYEPALGIRQLLNHGGDELDDIVHIRVGDVVPQFDYLSGLPTPSLPNLLAQFLNLTVDGLLQVTHVEASLSSACSAPLTGKPSLAKFFSVLTLYLFVVLVIG